MKPKLSNQNTVRFFSSLTSAQKNQFYRIGVKRIYPKGRVIHQEGDRSAFFSVILKGSVIVCRSKQSGQEIVTTVLSELDSFGELPLFTGTPRTHTAIAAQEVELLNVSKERFDKLLDEQPKLKDLMLASLSHMLIITLNMLDDERGLPVNLRLAKYLVQQSTRMGSQILKLRQADIAYELGISRLSTSQGLKQIAETRLIKMHYGAVEVLDIDGLTEWVSMQIG